MAHKFIDDEEILYRCVFAGRDCYRKVENRIVVSSQAFTDREKQPSVDRAKLCDHDPNYTQQNPDDGVVSLVTKEVRQIDIVQNDPKGKPEFTYKIDVIYRPLEDNIAHAQIEPSPEYKNQKPFRKLLEKLAVLADQRGWEVEPKID